MGDLSDFMKDSLGFVVGLVVGVGFTGIAALVNPDITRAELYKKDQAALVEKINPKKSDQKVLRIYRPGRDVVLVEETPNKYITLDSYLDTIKDEADRNLERARIERLVGWYK